ncbi:hypothetical protein Ahy_B02g058659 [Arachis hypogaea]|uniref:Uncharacterized protein n=1 Tax=Arachis hypogaea TaxID=3818 RepID=A0A445AF16_ARAHY|nr:hypothetical protein Ahy_B02g058659 [Arachis hypogaea]
MDDSWCEGIFSFKNSLKECNANIFGDILKKKRKILRRLHDISIILILKNSKYNSRRSIKRLLLKKKFCGTRNLEASGLNLEIETQFYHGSMMIRRRKNRGTFLVICRKDLMSIGKSILPLEIKIVVFGMDGYKWEKVGNDLYSLIGDIFQNPAKVKDINETLITLIPKVEPVTSLKQLWPISYKVITKVLANRLKVIMEKLVRPPIQLYSRTQEIIYSMRNKKDTKGWMAIKIDLGRPMIYLNGVSFKIYLLILTRVFLSKNIGNHVRTKVSEALHFARTDNLGKYLGVPLLHLKVSKCTFNDIINKLNSRINSWKVSSVSLAGRTTLVKSILSSTSLYTMQIALLPTATCNAIDCKCKSFIWRDTNQARKIHLLSGKKVGKPKKSSGLRILQASKMNQALMMKKGWGFIAKKDAL